MKILIGLLMPWMIMSGVAARAAEPPAVTSRIVLGKAIDPPAGFTAMCLETPDLCTTAEPQVDIGPVAPEIMTWPTLVSALVSPIPVIPTMEIPVAAPVVADLAPVTVVATPTVAPAKPGDSADLLNRINRRVNHGVRQYSDLLTTGRDDVWQRSGVGRGAVGDCEDIALEKRALLIDAGFPADRLALAVVYSRRSGLHTVLVATNGDVDVVLDSRRTSIRPWHRARYRWIAMQSHTNVREWQEVMST